MKHLPVRDPGTAIIRKVPGKDKMQLAMFIKRFTGLHAWVEHGIIEVEYPRPSTEVVRINGVTIFKQPARGIINSNSSPQG